jgi:hypothetical protein
MDELDHYKRRSNYQPGKEVENIECMVGDHTSKVDILKTNLRVKLSILVLLVLTLVDRLKA